MAQGQAVLKAAMDLTLLQHFCALACFCRLKGQCHASACLCVQSFVGRMEK